MNTKIHRKQIHMLCTVFSLQKLKIVISEVSMISNNESTFHKLQEIQKVSGAGSDVFTILVSIVLRSVHRPHVHTLFAYMTSSKLLSA